MNDHSDAFTEAAELFDAERFLEGRKVLSRVFSDDTENDRARANALSGWSRYQDRDFEGALMDFNKAIGLVGEARAVSDQSAS